MFSRLSLYLALTGMLVISSGCGSDGPQREFAEVTGKVSYKGVPLKVGRIEFQPASGAAASSEIEIDGTYTLQGEVGENTVTVTSTEGPDPLSLVNPESGKPPPPPSGPPKSNIPIIYNTPQGGLKFTVKSGTNTADFDLQ